MTADLHELIHRITTERAQEATERTTEHHLTEQGHGYQVYDELRTDHAENDQHRLDTLLHALHTTPTLPHNQTLPRHPDGTINTSAEFGPGPQRRLGILVDHLVAGSKESRLAAGVTSRASLSALPWPREITPGRKPAACS